MSSYARPATPRSRFHQLADEPIDHDGERFKISTPKDYQFEGFYAAPNGERTNAVSFDMTWREMTENNLMSVPANYHRYNTGSEGSTAYKTLVSDINKM